MTRRTPAVVAVSAALVALLAVAVWLPSFAAADLVVPGQKPGARPRPVPRPTQPASAAATSAPQSGVATSQESSSALPATEGVAIAAGLVVIVGASVAGLVVLRRRGPGTKDSDA